MNRGRRAMWLKNLIFSAVCLLFVSFVFALVMPFPGVDTPQPVTADRDDLDDIIAAVDNEFEASWISAKLEPAGVADDYTVARRISLSLTGTVPSIEDLKVIESLPPHDRIDWYTQRLLADRRHSNYFAERLGRAYVGTDQGLSLIHI